MSMHEVEGAVEYAVRHLAASDFADKRSAYAALYRYQQGFDCGYTHFRVIEHLTAANFVYQRAAGDHPDFDTIAPALEKLGKSGFLLVDPNAEYNEKKNPEAGFFQEGALYFDAGSPMWRRFVDAGLLSGQDAEPPNRWTSSM